MFVTTAQESSGDNKRKRVRFDDRVKIVEIERFGMILEETNDEASKTSSGDSIISFDNSSDISTPTSIFSMYSFVPSCSSSNAHSTRCRFSLVGPDRIPSMLFNSLPESADRHPNRSDGRRRSQAFKSSSLSPSAPIRAPSIDEIVDCALAIIEQEDTPRTTLGRRSRDRMKGQQNYVWSDNDFVVTGCKRWTEASHTPPKIPRRKISATSLEEALGRKS